MGSNFLFDWGTSNQAFAAGQVGMYTQGSDVYTALVQANQIDPAIYGLTTIPLTDDPNAGVLAGGDIAAVNVKASRPRSRRPPSAGSTSTTCRSCSTRTPRSGCRRRWRPTASPSGTPQMPIFDQATLEQSQDWIADYINVPLEQMTGFTDGHLRAAARAASRASTPRRCTPSSTPSCRPC